MTIEATLTAILEELKGIRAALDNGTPPAAAPKAPPAVPESVVEPEAIEPVPEKAPEPQAAPEPAEQPTLDAIGKKITGLIAQDAAFRQPIVALLAEFGAKKASDVEDDQRAAFMQGLEAIG